MQKKLIKLTSIFLMALILSACGFHLRDAFQLPEKYSSIAIDVPREYREFNRILGNEMQRVKFPLQETVQDPALTVRVFDVSEKEDLLTASATGSPLERKVILSAKVQWLNALSEDVLEPESFVLQRTFVYDDTSVLAKRREADSLMRELETELSRRIILRMRQLN